MSTRRWMGELEKWMERSDQSKADVARRSKHSTAHVLALFDSPDPNPSLQLYLDVVGVTGGRFASVRNNTSAAVIERLKEIKDREKISTVALSKKTGITRPMLSTLLNHPDPNPSLATFDRIVAALNAEEEFHLVNILAHAVRLAIAAGATNNDEIRQAVASAVDATSANPRHLRIVPDAPLPDYEASRWAEQERRDAEERLQEANGRVAELCEKCSALQLANVSLEKRHADDAAEIRRLDRQQRRNRIGWFAAGLITGIGVTAGVIRARQ